MSASLLEVQSVCKTYGGGLLSRTATHAVKDVTFTMSAQEIFTIIGESGSGKTTLSRMILKLLVPSSGTIRFEGRTLRELRSRKDRLAFMSRVQPIFQNPYEAFNPLKRVDRYLYVTARRLARVAQPQGQARFHEPGPANIPEPLRGLQPAETD